MRIGIPKETKDKENRVALTPSGASELVSIGHEVSIEDRAGEGSGFSNEDYVANGASIVSTSDAWNRELVLKIKEPLQSEYQYLKDNILFTYLHLAGVDPALTDALLNAGTTAVAYETVEDENGKLPLLAPMSAVAGNIAANVGGYYLAKFNGGKGMQLGQVMGNSYGKAMVIGNGIVGQHAAHMLQSMGTCVLMVCRERESFDAMAFADPAGLEYVQSTPDTIAGHIADSDLVIGAALLAGARAPHVVTEKMVETMQPGSVIVDVSIDQGGCIETSRPTSHSDPVYIQYDVIHYCVTNMPGAYPRTSTLALTNATFEYIVRLADSGLDQLSSDPGFAKGVNTCHGYICYKPVAEALEKTDCFQPLKDIR
ncbi:MAG: alanine dehydrogenase [Gammaproteobacteria bacterium]|nr:alanine dehydrogenase [Gammaproteobacteria bacterium]